MDHRTLAYLATPYSKYPAGPVQAFICASALAARLLRSGVHVYSPITHTHPLAVHGNLDPLDHSIWLPFDEVMMSRCDTLIVAHMDGWQESKGIAHEVAFFERARKPIYDLPDITTVNMVRREPPLNGIESARARCAEIERQIASAPEWGAQLTALSEERRSLQIFLSYAEGPLPPLNYREG